MRFFSNSHLESRWEGTDYHPEVLTTKIVGRQATWKKVDGKRNSP
jgi:hypothetical protein